MPNPQGDDDRRRVSREEGERLLLGAAMDVARGRGELEEGVYVNPLNCRITRQSIVLCQSDGAMISRIPLPEARRSLAFRRQVARQALQRSGVVITAGSTATVERRALRNLDHQLRALAWAIGAGRRFPMPPKAQQQRLIGMLLALGVLLILLNLVYGGPAALTVLLAIALAPGGVLLWRHQKQKQQFERDLENLARRWRTLGHPDPSDSFFALYHL